MRPFVENKCGLEIGGPSGIFRATHLLPVYAACARIDVCNFSSENIWTTPKDDQRFEGHLGAKFTAEASDLSLIGDETYDFVIASHVLEHTANPLLALQEWKRVLRPEGVLLLVVPDKRVSFDRRREFTSFHHIEADLQRNTSENDLTHLNEVLSLHDFASDPGAGSREKFHDRCLQNFSVRAMHHHVFSPELLVKMFTRYTMRVLNVTVERPFHLIAFAQKTNPAESERTDAHNENYLNASAAWRNRDPFARFR